MAGGEGTRLRPLTANHPKPMLPMANRPMMEHIVALLERHGITEVVVTVAFMANVIRNYFGDGAEFGVSMVYATEETPLGTAGSVRNARDELTERFLVISGDVLTDIDISAVVEFHEQKGALATIALKSMEDPLEFGIVITKPDGRIERFLEKPGWGQVFSDRVNTGIYVLEPEIFDLIDEGRPVDFSGEVFPAALAKGLPIYGCPVEGYWEDVGTLDAYLRAHRDVLSGKVQVELDGFEIRPGVWVGEGASVDPSAKIVGPALIGPNVHVGPGTELGPHNVLGANVRVGHDARLERSVVHDHVFLGAGSQLVSTIVGRSSVLRHGVRCEEGAVLGESCLVGGHALIRPRVKVYPFKTVEPGAVVTTSIVWESRGSRTLFSPEGVKGLANLDATPELAVRLAMAWAGTLPRGSTVVVSRDSSRAARMLKRAVMVGCNAAGVNVEDLEIATVPLTRYQIRATGGIGGVTVRLAAEDHESVLMRFLDEEGLDLDEVTQRKVERLYYREEFRRVRASEIGDIEFPGHGAEHYTADLIGSVDVRAVRRAGFKLVLDYAYGTASLVMPYVLAKLGAHVLVVNPYASTTGAMAYDRERNAAAVAELVLASRADLGAVIDPDAERITFVDDTGRVLSDDESLLALVDLTTKVKPGTRVAVPVSAPSRVEAIAAANEGVLCWTKLSAGELMRAVSRGSADLSASQMGAFAFASFMPGFDAAGALVHMMEALALAKERLSEVVKRIGPVHLAHEAVVTRFEDKGQLMRLVVEQVKGREAFFIDGVKVVEPDGWVLVLPDPQEPLTHVWAEGPTETAARARAQEQAVRLRQLLG